MTIFPSKSTLLNWVKKIRAMGAEPIIQVSQYKSAAVAADLVKYFNVDLKDQIAPIKYWNIGNEPWLQYNSLASGTDVGTLVETYFKPIAAAMKEVDPTIKIFGPDFCYYVEFAINDLFGGKNDIAGKVPGKDYYYCDGISWHKYPQNENINLAYQGIDEFKSSIVKCKQKLIRLMFLITEQVMTHCNGALESLMQKVGLRYIHGKTDRCLAVSWGYV